MTDSVLSDDRQALAKLDPQFLRRLWRAADWADDYAQQANDRPLSAVLPEVRSVIVAVLEAMVGTDSGAPVFTTSHWLEHQLDKLSPLKPGSAAERLDAMARVNLWAHSLTFTWRSPRRNSRRYSHVLRTSVVRSVLFGRAESSPAIYQVSHDVPLDAGLAQLLYRLYDACRPPCEIDFDSSLVISLSKIAYTRLLADIRADAWVGIDRNAIGALVLQLWSAIADVMPGSRTDGRLSSVLKLALSLYGMATASAFSDDHDDQVLDS